MSGLEYCRAKDLPGSQLRRHVIDPTDDLVTPNDRIFDVQEFAVDDVEIGPAHAAGADPDLPIAWRRILPLLQQEGRPGSR
jgi:hypothetical protein